MNLYTYCLNNPVIYVDPTGRSHAWLYALPAADGPLPVGEAIAALYFLYTIYENSKSEPTTIPIYEEDLYIYETPINETGVYVYENPYIQTEKQQVNGMPITESTWDLIYNPSNDPLLDYLNIRLYYNWGRPETLEDQNLRIGIL